MDRTVIEWLARRAGLARALAEFPDDVAAAAAQAGSHSEAIAAPDISGAEPWPPMRAGDAL